MRRQEIEEQSAWRIAQKAVSGTAMRYAPRATKKLQHTQIPKIMRKFRFEDLEIWQDAIVVSDELFDLADKLEDRKWFRFAEQLRGATLSITNNICEGSGSTSKPDFARFLNYSKRSVFEVANILFVLHRRQIITEETLDRLLDKLDHQSRKIVNFRKSL